MRSWKLLFFGTAAVLVASNLFWAYAFTDQGVSYSYQSDHVEELERVKVTLGDLIVVGSSDYTKADVLHLLRQVRPDAFIVEEAERVDVDGIVFHFKDDKLEAIR